MKQQQGFIFLEILIAAIIISVGFASAAAVFIPATANHAIAADYTVAANLAQKQLELLKTVKPAEWNNALLLGSLAWQGEESNPISVNDIKYTVITEVASANASNLLVKATVIVSWARNGRMENMQFISFYSKV